MEKKNNELLQKAIQWYVSNYHETPEEAGLKSSAIWNKPLIKRNFCVYKLQEVVFGETEKDVHLFIKIQTMLRWLVVFFIWTMMPCILSFPIIIWRTAMSAEIEIYGKCVMALLIVSCLIYFSIGFYLGILSKNLKDDKIITFMDV